MPESVWIGFGQEGVMREHGRGHEGIFDFRTARELEEWLRPLFDGVCARHGDRARRGGAGRRTHRDSSGS